ncbi:MAG TPA: hypothetical protein VFB36_00630 [Nevskiaceae bacterium]|nr:hypothetical protein [Nevskiaceae bacterium]
MIKTLLAAGFVCLAGIPAVVHAGDVGGTPARVPVAPMPATPTPAPAAPTPAPASEWYPAQQPAPQEAPVRATSNASPAARQALDDAISHQKTKRALSITGIVIGGAVVIGGLVYAASEAQRKANESGKDQVYVNWIGLGAGIPIIAVSIYSLASAQKQLNRLRVQRAQLGLAPRKDGAEIMFSAGF